MKQTPRQLDKKTHISITLTESLIRDMRTYVPQRQVSKFIQEIVQKEIDHKKEMWAQAYREAAQDEERNAEIALWDNLIGDGLDETNEYSSG